ncbi:MAG TPA: 30S ribosomal protein S20 [Candidatus Bathyarchaeia archaeon]|nr:30S ribosomal protein S20 [Candidatus Bathyarchaeia archaeon]
MPIIASAKKRVRQTEKKRLRNAARKSEIKTLVKKLMEAIEHGTDSQAAAMFREVTSKFARAKSKKVIPAKTAQRKISRLAKQIAAKSKKS